MVRASALRAALLPVALAVVAGPPPARAQEQNHPGLAVEWMVATQGRCERIALGDLDGDGNPDLLVDDAGPGVISLWWNDGHARFPERTTLAVEPTDGGLVLLDADGDGRLDIVLGRPEPLGGVVVRRSLGARQFAGPVVTAEGLPSSRRLVAADMNGDGRADLVGLSDAGERTAGVALNRGGGVFAAGAPLANGIGGRAVAVADFDRDGLADVACAPVTDAIRGVRILRGDGAGGLAPLAEFERVFPDGPRELLAVDLDGDGDADLVSTDPYGRLGIHFNDGAGGFTGIERQPSSSGYGVGVALAQLDRDEAPEVIVTSARRRLGPRLVVHQAGEDPQLERGRAHSYYHFHEMETAPDLICAGDLDRDGRNDLVLLTRFPFAGPDRDGNSRIGVIRSRRIGGLGAIAFHPAVPMTALRLARFDGETPELVMSGAEGVSRTRLDASGELTAPRRVSAGLQAWPLDADGDGRDDLAIAVSADSLALRLTRRDGEVGEEVARWAGQWVAGGDLGGHPGDEVVFLDPGGHVAIAWSHARRPAQHVTATEIPGPARRIVIANAGLPHARLIRLAPDGGENSINRPTHADTAIVYRVLPDGRFHEAVRSPIAREAHDPHQFQALMAADLDGKFGDELLILRASFNGSLDVVRSFGAGRFSATPERYGLRPEGPRALAFDDFDGDGDRDFFWVAQEEGSIDRLHFLWNDGEGHFGDPWVRYLAGSWAAAAAAGDLDGDGRADLALATRSYATPTSSPGAVALLFGEPVAAGRGPSFDRRSVPVSAVGGGSGPLIGRLFPNPIRSEFAVGFTLARHDPATLELYDLAGRRVMVERLADAGPSERTLQLRLPDGLRAGVYWLALRQGAAVSSRRITVMR